MPEGGKDLGGFQRLTALKVEEVIPYSHVYMQKDGGEGTWKVPRISSSLLALKTEIEGGNGFGTWIIL